MKHRGVLYVYCLVNSASFYILAIQFSPFPNLLFRMKNLNERSWSSLLCSRSWKSRRLNWSSCLSPSKRANGFMSPMNKTNQNHSSPIMKSALMKPLMYVNHFNFFHSILIEKIDWWIFKILSVNYLFG